MGLVAFMMLTFQVTIVVSVLHPPGARAGDHQVGFWSTTSEVVRGLPGFPFSNEVPAQGPVSGNSETGSMLPRSLSPRSKRRLTHSHRFARRSGKEEASNPQDRGTRSVSRQSSQQRSQDHGPGEAGESQPGLGKKRSRGEGTTLPSLAALQPFGKKPAPQEPSVEVPHDRNVASSSRMPAFQEQHKKTGPSVGTTQGDAPAGSLRAPALSERRHSTGQVQTEATNHPRPDYVAMEAYLSSWRELQATMSRAGFPPRQSPRPLQRAPSLGSDLTSSTSHQVTHTDNHASFDDTAMAHHGANL